MRKIITYASISLLTIGCKDKLPDTVGVISYKTTYELPDSLKNEIEKTVLDYQNHFCIAVHDTLTIEDSCEGWRAHEHYDSISVRTRAWGKNKSIRLNAEIFNHHNATRSNIRECIAHELFHTLRPSYASRVSPQLHLKNGLIIESYLGLTVYTNKKIIRLLEEGTADLFVRSLIPQHESYCRSYKNGANLLSVCITENWLSNEDLISAVQTNDVPFIIGKLVNKSDAQLKLRDIEYVLNIFSALDTAKSYEYQLKKLKRYRKP